MTGPGCDRTGPYWSSEVVRESPSGLVHLVAGAAVAAVAVVVAAAVLAAAAVAAAAAVLAAAIFHR